MLRILSQRPDGPSVATAVSADKNFIVEAIYPTAQQQKRIRFLPENVSKRFDQAEATFELKSAPNLAVTGYRSCLELGIKHIDPNLKGSLAARTKALVIGGKLPSALAEWIDEVRGAGNDAIHDEDEFSQKDADAIREFCAIVLRSLFEIPGEIAERRARSIGASTATP